MFFKYLCLSLCVIFSTFFAASDDTGSAGFALVAQAIQDDNLEEFNMYCKDSFAYEDIDGAMLLLYAAYTQRSKRANTDYFIKTLLAKGANPTLSARIRMQTCRITQQDENKVSAEGSTSFHDLPAVIDAAILAGNVKAVEALCLSEVDISKTNMRLSSWCQTILRTLALDFETPLEHADRYFEAIQSGAPTSECKATEDELFDIIETLRDHTERREEESCVIL